MADRLPGIQGVGFNRRPWEIVFPQPVFFCRSPTQNLLPVFPVVGYKFISFSFLGKEIAGDLISKKLHDKVN